METLVHNLVTNQFTRSLEALRDILEKARGHAVARKFDADKYLDLKMAPDMFSFSRQIQIATDTAKGACARLSGKEAPKFSDDEKTFDELVSRIGKTLEYINGFKSTDFSDFKNKSISFPYLPGMHIQGEDFLVSHAIPNFYFHMSAVYGLLRSNGVEIGKRDYLGKQNWIKD